MDSIQNKDNKLENSGLDKDDKQEKKNSTKNNSENKEEDQKQNKDTKKHELEDKENKILKDQLLRSLAEIDNLRKRYKKEKDNILQYSVMNFARDIVLVKDNLQRALKNISYLDEIKNKDKDLKEEEAFIKGIIITDKEFLNTLNKYNI